MLSEHPTPRDLAAIRELCAARDVDDRQRARLLAMDLVTGPPYEMTARATRLLGCSWLVLALALIGCGGEPFSMGIGPAPDAGAVSADTVAPAAEGDAGDVARADRDAGPELGDVGPDALGLDAQALDVAPPSTDADGKGWLDAPSFDSASDSAPDSACAPGSLLTFATPATGCMCETPATYTCLARGAVCGSCPPSVQGNPLGHADGSCNTPNVCVVGAPCHYQGPTGALVMGSVVGCP